MSNHREMWAERARNVLKAKTDDFRELISLAALDSRKDLRFQDWSDCDFSNCDLRGFDFTASRLHNCRFENALIEGARFDQAEINGTNLRTAIDWERYVKSWHRSEELPLDDHLPVGAVFQDAPFAPEMVVVPAGKFLMGSPADHPGGVPDERPQHEVTIPQRFAVGRYAVTFTEWDAALAAAGVSHDPDDQDWGRGQRPVINVSWKDAQAFVKWLSEKTGAAYRLLSEAEWEYVCRAGTKTPFWWGSAIRPDQANYDGNYTYEGHRYRRGVYRQQTLPVDSFEPNEWGLYQVHGNVQEWCEDRWHENYEGKPSELNATGVAWKAGGDTLRVLRGGSWYDFPGNLSSAFRNGVDAEKRTGWFGFRVVRTLTS